MATDVKFLKIILTKKRRLGEYKIVAFTKECNVISHNKLHLKPKDLNSFTISYTVGALFFSKALGDLGASINLMPLSIYKKLGLKEIKPTTITLQLANQTLTYPKGIAEDVLVKIDKFIFLAGFIVLNMEEDRQVPIIQGKPFLCIVEVLINVEKE